MASSKENLEEKLRDAAHLGDVAKIIPLLDLGADIDAKNWDGETALMKASWKGHMECVEVLLDKGAEVNMLGNHRKTALMKASEWGHMKCVKMLLDKGAEVNLQDTYGKTALMSASWYGHMECVKALLDKGAEVNKQDNYGKTALMSASWYGHMECVKALLDKGAEVNKQDNDGETALMKASESGQMNCVRVLLDKGADVNIPNNGGGTALMKASEREHMECVNVLLDKGAQVNIQNNNGETALMKASESGQMNCVRVLLDKGADVNIQYNDGETALMKASESGQIMYVRVLLDKGADLNIPNNDGETALMKASWKGHMECVKVLLDKGAEVNKQDKDGETALMKASWKGHTVCVKVLLDKDADVNKQDKDGGTALMMASERGHMECVKALLDKGADVNIQNNIGDTALHIATQYLGTDREGIITLVLLSHPGIEINLKNKQGHTAMMDASYKSLIVFNQVVKTCIAFPVDSYGKVVLCGNSGAGKSTLTQAIINISKPTAARLVKRVFGQKDVIEPLTAGIIPHQVDSPYSNMVIYDLAGHHKYFSSHSACLEAISLDSAAIFLLLQDLRKDPEAMTKEVYYWSTMIDGVCHKCPQQPSVMVVGTHVDLLTPEQLTEKVSHLGLIARAAISHQMLVDVIAVNLTRIYSGGMDQFRNLLYRTIKEVLSMSPPISMMCHMMLAFLREKLPPDMHAISLSDLLVRLKADQEKVINPDITAVIPVLKALSGKGLIVFIPCEDPDSSWVVLHKESILKRVNGALFADPSFKEYVRLASNTGIISTAIIKSTFPEYDADMITQLMVHFEIGHAVDLSQIITNMAPEGSTSSDLGPLFFIPALVNVDRPSSATVPKNSFSWSEDVKSTHQFFTPRFHHVLLYRLPNEFALPPVHATPHHSHLSRTCDVWSRGVKWISETGVTTIVEMSESFQSLSLTISSPDKADLKYLELAHSVVKVIKNTRQEFCPYLEVVEVITCPPEASSDHSNDTRVELSSLKEALLEGNKHLVDVKREKHAVMEEWMKVEPCLPQLIGVPPLVIPSSSCLLSEPAAVSSPELLSELIGQSPQLLSELIGQSPDLEEAPTLPKLLCFSDGNVNICQQIGVNYSKFGILLLNDTYGAVVNAIENEHHHNAEKINIAIFRKWLEGMGEKPVAWSTLVATLKKINM